MSSAADPEQGRRASTPGRLRHLGSTRRHRGGCPTSTHDSESPDTLFQRPKARRIRSIGILEFQRDSVLSVMSLHRPGDHSISCVARLLRGATTSLRFGYVSVSCVFLLTLRRLGSRWLIEWIVRRLIVPECRIRGVTFSSLELAVSDARVGLGDRAPRNQCVGI